MNVNKQDACTSQKSSLVTRKQKLRWFGSLEQDDIVGSSSSMETCSDDVRKSGPPQVPVRIQMGGHCLICLRKISSHKNICGLRWNEGKSDQFKIVPTPAFEDETVSLSSLLKCLNKIWGCLKKGRGGDDPLDLMEVGEKEVFGFLPEMCHFCVEKLTTIDKMIRSLRDMLGELGQIARESKDGRWSWRGEDFVKALSSSHFAKRSIRQTLEILELQVNPESRKRKLNEVEDEGASLPPEDASTFSVLDPDSDPLAIPESKLTETSTCDKVIINDNSHERTEFVDENDSEDWPIVNVDDDQCSIPGKKDNQEEDPDYVKSAEEDNGPISASPVVVVNKALRQDTARKNDASLTSPQPKMVTLVSVPNSGRTYGAAKSLKILAGPKIKTQICDLCKLPVPVKQILDHIRDHVGDEYILRCPNPKCPIVSAKPFTISKHLRGSLICGRSVAGKDTYITQIQKCQVCQYKTSRSTGLQLHLNTHHENDSKNFPCPVKDCQEIFTWKQSLILHLPYHDFCRHANLQRCPQCSKQIKVEEMEQHLKDHQVQEIIKCNQCAFLFSTREQLVAHLHAHRFNLLSCDICKDGESFNFNRYVDLREHYFQVHQIGQKYLCERCDFMGWTMERLATHTKVVHSGGKPKYRREKDKCDECDKEFWFIQDHKIKVHGADPFKCKFCGEKFTSSALFKRHDREHKGVQTKFGCEWEGCGRVLESRSSLRKHVAAVHKGEKPHVCDLCGKSFARTNSLRLHKRQVHSDLRPHLCDICGESFKIAQSLHKHKQMHTGVRPFPCEYCGQRFREKTNLKAHVKGHLEKGDDFKPSGPRKPFRSKRRNTSLTKL